MVVSLQFQDRTKQRLQNVADTMSALAIGIGEVPLGEMRARFVPEFFLSDCESKSSTDDAGGEDVTAHHEASEDIELFDDEIELYQ